MTVTGSSLRLSPLLANKCYTSASQLRLYFNVTCISHSTEAAQQVVLLTCVGLRSGAIPHLICAARVTDILNHKGCMLCVRGGASVTDLEKSNVCGSYTSGGVRTIVILICRDCRSYTSGACHRYLDVQVLQIIHQQRFVCHKYSEIQELQVLHEQGCA